MRSLDSETLFLRADIGEAEQDRTVEVVWTTGARVLKRYLYEVPSLEELAIAPENVRMGRLQSGTAPFLADHDPSTSSILGVIDSATLTPSGGTAVIRFPSKGTNADSDRVYELVKQKVIRSVSVGYKIHAFEKAGEQDGVPVVRVIDWEPCEISAVAIPADAGAHFRREDFSHKEHKMTEEEKKKLAEEAARNAAEIATRAAMQERERASGIRAACRAAQLDEVYTEKLITDGVSLVEARGLAMGELEKRTAVQLVKPRIEVGVTDGDKYNAQVRGWLLEKSGHMEEALKCRELAKAGKLSPQHAKLFADVDVDGGELRGMSLLDLGKDVLERQGQRTRGVAPPEMAKRMLLGQQFMYTERAAGFAPSSDFSVLYENVMHKMLLGAYLLAETTWQRICKTESVPDFRLSNRFRVGSFGTMDVVKENEEYKNKTMPDGLKTAISTQTYGNIIGLSRQSIINDDMGANADMAVRFGQGFKLTLEKAFYDMLALNAGMGPTMSDSNPFFHASRANINATGSALSVAGLDADRVVLKRQKDISNNQYLSLLPKVILVATELGNQARRLNTAPYDTDTAGKFQLPNLVLSLFKDVVDSPWLSGTRRYIFADPGIAPAFVMAFLQGSGEAPFLEQQLGWRTDGIEWKARLDAQVQAFDPKGAVTNAGT